MLSRPSTARPHASMTAAHLSTAPFRSRGAYRMAARMLAPAGQRGASTSPPTNHHPQQHSCPRYPMP
jgi:hypothetical protein